MSRRLKLASAICLCALLCLPGCASKKDADKDKPPAPVEKMYNDAKDALDRGEYHKAAAAFDDVDREYPYSQWAIRAQLMEGYADYKNLKYDEAILALDHFIELHPGDPNVAYAYYLRALCYYEQISDVGRDQKMTEMALENLKQVVTRFPDSKYARDASLKMDLTNDHLAGKEMSIGRYYLVRHQYTGAIPRFKNVVDNYQTTTDVPEALERLVECYLSLGLVDEAKKSAAILGHNYPESSWYKDAYKLMKGDTGEAPPKKSIYQRTIGRIL